MADHTDEINQYLSRLFPICRSITGEGNRQTLQILSEIAPIIQHEVPSGKQVYDWMIPDEWNIRDAWIATAGGRHLVDFQENNVHIMSYSEPVKTSMEWSELKLHLHTHSELSEGIPYRTTYYKRNWGFCITRAQYDDLKKLKGPFTIVIDSELKPGSLTYGECLLPGLSPQEILISCYICHPSMANDSLSGMLLTAFLANHINKMEGRQWSYRVVFVPETIGAIAYCSANEKAMKQIDMGFVITTVGGPGKIGYKQSWQKDHVINKMIEEVLSAAEQDFITYPFDIHGSDERQYSSQGFRINVATICKDKYYEYPFYHTSLDDLSFVKAEHINSTLMLYLQLIKKLERHSGFGNTPFSQEFELERKENQSPVYRNLYPNCEVMLSKHGLYPDTGGRILPGKDPREELDVILWLLFYCDGFKSLKDIAVELEVDESSIFPVVQRLVQKGILVNV